MCIRFLFCIPENISGKGSKCSVLKETFEMRMGGEWEMGRGGDKASGRVGDGAMGRVGDRAMGRRDDGASGRQGEGEIGRQGDGETGRPERATQPSPAATPWGINERNPSAEKRQTKQLPCFGRLPALQGKEM
jgi:hypothetical protein